MYMKNIVHSVCVCVYKHKVSYIFARFCFWVRITPQARLHNVPIKCIIATMEAKRKNGKQIIN